MRASGLLLWVITLSSHGAAKAGRSNQLDTLPQEKREHVFSLSEIVAYAAYLKASDHPKTIRLFQHHAKEVIKKGAQQLNSLNAQSYADRDQVLDIIASLETIAKVPFGVEDGWETLDAMQQETIVRHLEKDAMMCAKSSPNDLWRGSSMAGLAGTSDAHAVIKLSTGLPVGRLGCL